jgi:endonuclease III
MAISPSTWALGAQSARGRRRSACLDRRALDRADNILGPLPLPSNKAISIPDAHSRRVAARGRQTGLDEARRRIPKRDRSWRRPSRRRVAAIRDRLRELYDRPAWEPHGHPIAELVRTILSQNTNDRNRDVAYSRMRERFPTWEQVRDAPQAELEEALRPGGLSATKAPRIQHVLEQLGEHPNLDWLATAPRQEALDFLTGLPGVGRKTAACVLIFALGRPEIPVDTHVHRVGGRLGLFRRRASFEEAHDEMLAITPPEDAYELHVNLIRHGRAICRPRPRCPDCELRRMCPAYRSGAMDAYMVPRQR